MEYHYKLYLWEDGHKTVEYTKYLTCPIFYEDRLNEEIDTGELVLDGVTFGNCFAPKTKFRLERFAKNNQEHPIKTWDFVVDHDDVEDYVDAPGIYCHRISIIEPSVIAQGIHIDNISLTYELQDVTLNYKTYSSDNTKVLIDKQQGGDEYFLRETKYDDTKDTATTGTTSSRTASFKNTYAYLWDEDDLSQLSELKLNLEVSQKHDISFKIPKLYVYGTSNGQTWDKKLFELNTIANVYRYKTQGGKILNDTKTLIKSQKHSPDQLDSANNEWYYSDGSSAALRIIDNTVVEDDGYTITPGTSTTFDNLYLTAATIAKVGNNQTDEVNFTTDTLSEEEINAGEGFYYDIEILADPINPDGMLIHYETGFYALFHMLVVYPYTTIMYGTFDPEVKELINCNNICIKTGFNIKDMSQDAEAGYLIMKGKKYSCYELLRKALLTIDTQIIDNNTQGVDDIEFLITIDPAWINRLKTAKVQETLLEEKNLWEVFLQVGYYLHAIPYLQFATDGTDRLMLSFSQLGNTKMKQDTNTKITVYNSQNLSEFFTQYDSYVTNIFSPQNEIDEWLVIKTNDASSLVSNNSAMIKTTYGISEIKEFDITYDGSAGGESGTKSALNHIFESSIYSILTADYNLSPGMGDSLYYTLGKNEIGGLTYVPPSVNNDMPMSLKRIVGKLFSNVSTSKLKFNNLMFHIKYKTQDSMRISQVRPDLENFVKNSKYEKFSHHEQYYGQQDKIIDSERLSLNLFGKLVRVGNNTYQCQEFVNYETGEKESGDLIEINGEPYYVAEVENEYYNNCILQKVTYSKNFNQLSNIVTIPSEPRFYEVSERSKITREIRLFDFFKISTVANTNMKAPKFLSKTGWHEFLEKLIFNKSIVTLPNYAWTRFKADELRTHKGAYGQYVDSKQMFPSSELDRTNENLVMPKDASDHTDVIVPLLHFPMKDGIQFEWDMEDNFKAGDAIDTEISGDNGTIDSAYFALQSIRYCDIMGRADLFSFRLFNKTNWNFKQSQSLPKACIEPAENESIAYLPLGEYKKNYIALDKDCRESLSFNYQISLLHNNDDGNGDFITFSNMFGTKDSKLHCCLLDEEVSMFNENTSAISANIVADDIEYSFEDDYINQQIKITFENLDIDFSKVKSVVFYEIDSNNDKVSYLAKNFKNGLKNGLPNLYIYPVFNT